MSTATSKIIEKSHVIFQPSAQEAKILKSDFSKYILMNVDNDSLSGTYSAWQDMTSFVRKSMLQN